MCGRIVYVWDPITEELVLKLIDDPGDLHADILHVVEKKRYNVPPASHLPIITQNGATTLQVARWGFPIPKRPNGVFNTRVERAAESPMWSGMLGRSHGLMPVTGFYEWRRTSGQRKEPYFIHRTDGQPLLLATLHGERPVGDAMERCTSVITCPPNAAMAPLHDRMPVIIETEDAADWLTADAQQALAMAKPAGDVLSMHRVTPDVGDTRNDEPRLMEPVDQQGLGAFTN